MNSTDNLSKLLVYNQIDEDLSNYRILQRNASRLMSFYRYLIKYNNRLELDDKIKEILSIPLVEVDYLDLLDISNHLRRIEELKVKLKDDQLLNSSFFTWLMLQAFKQLKSLRKLTIMGNNFNFDCQILRECLSELSSLEYFQLYVGEMSIKENAFENTFSRMEKLIDLRIVIRPNTFKQIGFVSFSQDIKSCVLLKHFELILHQNSIQDKGFMEFCSSLVKLISLENLILDIKDNQLTSKSGFWLGSSLKSLVNLRKLQLMFSDSKIYCTNEGIGKALKNLVKLNTLIIDLGFENIKFGEGFDLFEDIQQLEFLEQLSININQGNVDLDAAITLKNIFHQDSILKELKLTVCSGNSLSKYGIKLIGDNLKKLTKLESLNLMLFEEEQFSDKDQIVLIEGILSLQTLKQLSITFNNQQMSVEASRYFGCNLYRLKNLQNLDYFLGLSFYNQESIRQFDYFSQNIGKLENLRSLSLQLTSQTLQGIQNLATTLGCLTQLEKLSMTIGFKTMIKKQAFILFSGFEKLISLTSLCLDIGRDNQIQSGDIMSLGKSIGKLGKLQQFSFSLGRNNDINFEGALAIQEGLDQLKELRSLSLGFNENQMTEEGEQCISNSLKNLTKLESFNLFYKKNLVYWGSYFTFHQGLCYLSNLKILHISLDSEQNLQHQYYSKLVGALKGLQFLVDLSLILDPRLQQTRQIDSIVLYQQLSKLKALEKLAIQTPFLSNFELLALCQDLPKLQAQFLQIQYFQSIYFERERPLPIESDQPSSTNSIKKLDFVLQENMCLMRDFKDLLGLDNGLKKLIKLSHLSIVIPSDHMIRERGFQNIIDGLKQNQNLQYLYLDIQQSLKDELMKVITQGFSQLVCLTTLIVKENFSQSYKIHCFEMIKSILSLKKLITFKILNYSYHYTNQNMNQYQNIYRQELIRKHQRLIVFNTNNN